MSSSHVACDAPAKAVIAAMSSGVKLRPPSSIGVYANTGFTAVYVNANNIT